jgi:hypothetical protein
MSIQKETQSNIYSSLLPTRTLRTLSHGMMSYNGIENGRKIQYLNSLNNTQGQSRFGGGT